MKNVKKILIADDDAQTRLLLTTAFKDDYSVFRATDGVIALNMVLSHRPDVVILDGKMPRLDGLAVLGAIKADPDLSHITVLMLTGRGQFSDFERGILLGADAYFIKPVSPNILKLWVAKHLEAQRKTQDIFTLTGLTIQCPLRE